MRLDGIVNLEVSAPAVQAVSPGKNGGSSFVDVLRRGANGLEVEKKMSLPVAPVEVKRRDPLVKEKKLFQIEKPLGKDLCDRCGADNVKEGMNVSLLPANFDSRGKDDSCFGVSCADRQLSGVEHTFPSLLLWKCQLEKLKEDVDQALNRVCEGFCSFGPGCKSKRFGQKNSNKKKKRRLRWAPVAQKPRDDPLVAVRPDVGPSSASDYGGSEKVPAVSELSGGVCPSSFSSVPSVSEIQSPIPGRDPLPDFGTTAQEVGVGSHGSMAFSPVSPGPFVGSASSSDIPDLASLAFQPELIIGFAQSVPSLETNLAVVESSMHVYGEQAVGAGIDHSDTLVATVFSPSNSTLVSDPFPHKSSALRVRKGLDMVSVLEVEGAFSGGIPSKQEGSNELVVAQSALSSVLVEGGVGDEVEGLGPISVLPLAVEMDKDSSSIVSPRWVMERVKGYYKLIGVSCEQFEDKLLALF
jgi:hypothetical protein